MSVVFGIVGGATVLFALALGARSARRVLSWHSAYGVVTGNAQTHGSRGRIQYTPAVEFTTRHGQKVSFASSTATSWQSYRPGQSVRVLYRPDFPEGAEIASFARLWLTPLILSVFGFGVLAVAIYW